MEIESNTTKQLTNPSQRDTDTDGYGNYCDPDFDNNQIVNAAALAFFQNKVLLDKPLYRFKWQWSCQCSRPRHSQNHVFQATGGVLLCAINGRTMEQ